MNSSNDRQKSGQATLEYILLLSLILAVSVALVRGVMGGMDRGLGFFGGKLEKNLRSGKIPVKAWKN